MTMNDSDNLEAERLDGPQGEQPIVDKDYLIERLPHQSRTEINKLTIREARIILGDIDLDFQKWASRQQALILLKEQIKAQLLGDNR